MKTKTELKAHKIQFTEQRVLILDALKNAPGPLTIHDLMHELEHKVDLSTLYRSVELFEKKGIINKTELKEPLSSVYQYNKDKHTHYIICTQCKDILIIEECPLHDYEQKIALTTGYQIQEHQLNLYGLCPKCQTINR